MAQFHFRNHNAVVAQGDCPSSSRLMQRMDLYIYPSIAIHLMYSSASHWSGPIHSLDSLQGLAVIYLLWKVSFGKCKFEEIMMGGLKQSKFGPEKEVTEHVEFVDPKDSGSVEKLDYITSSLSNDEDKQYSKPPTTARDLVSEVLTLDDDPSLDPWTFRMWFLGIGLSMFASYGRPLWLTQNTS